nr:RNA methyltransferase [Cyanobacterium stanieri]
MGKGIILRAYCLLPKIVLSSLKNPLIKEIRKLQRPAERHRQNLCLLEGTNLLDVASQVNYPLDTLLFTPIWQNKNYLLAQTLQNQAQRVEMVSDEVMKSLATTVNPDGVLATASRYHSKSKDPENIRLGVVLERLQDPGNLGTIIRSSVAMGVDMLWLSGDSVDLDNPKVMRASAGEWFRVKARAEDDLITLVQSYGQKGYQIIATSLEGNKTPWEVDFSLPTIFLMGNESRGLSPDLAALATEKVKIPLLNGVESLNVAIATSLFLMEYQRQQQKIYPH